MKYNELDMYETVRDINILVGNVCDNQPRILARMRLEWLLNDIFLPVRSENET